ncbi:MAG: hypothetical protein KGI54_18950 [Pseudomonadota bacterium]|nr:hypothetical protein [Pseudomonadota bacterium]
MRINENLNLVLPVREDEDGNPLVYAFHTPITREIFEASFRIIAATKASLFGKGFVFAADTGPRIAALTLKDEGRRDAESRGEVDEQGHPRDGGAHALLAEIKRLTLILAPSSHGWDMLPVDTAIHSEYMDEDEWREVESALVFFTCPYALATKTVKENLASVIASVLRGLITSSPVSEYAASLPKLTGKQGSTEKESSVPS